MTLNPNLEILGPTVPNFLMVKTDQLGSRTVDIALFSDEDLIKFAEKYKELLLQNATKRRTQLKN